VTRTQAKLIAVVVGTAYGLLLAGFYVLKGAVRRRR
jgi:hypothetical protein